MEQLGADIESGSLTTILKIRMLSVFPDLRTHLHRKDALLTFIDDIGGARRKACDHDSDAMHLARATQAVHREMFEKKLFDGPQGKMPERCCTTINFALVDIIQEGPNIMYPTQVTAIPKASLPYLSF